MRILWFVVAGLSAGVLGGMGMGGGTVLIPLLSIFYKIGQHTAQAINLISFIPMAVIALIFHLKNKLVRFDKLLYIIIPGIACCVVGCYLANALGADLLRRFFGGFLLALSVFQFVSAIRAKH